MKTERFKMSEHNSLPYHLAIIMDGNGRWALNHNYDRTHGHKRGIETLKNTITECKKLGIKILSVYAFSTENWKRPKEEVDFLMTLLVYYLKNEIDEINKKNIKIRFIGRINELPSYVIDEIIRAENLTSSNNDFILNVAVNYGGRAEIIDAVNSIIASGISEIDENNFKNFLYFKDIPYPDLIIRTGGEKRISNFLLWEMAYSELYFTDVLWPDFSKEDLYKAIYDYAQRERRYGGI